MPATMLIDSMERLIESYAQLHQTALKKTEVIKDNDIGTLNAILREEQKQLAAIQLADKKRQEAVHILSNGSTVTMSDIIEKMAEPKQSILIDLQNKLSKVLEDLTYTNRLNQELLEQSLQFIHLNLDLLAPEPELPNYSKTQEQPIEQTSGKSVFDSKA